MSEVKRPERLNNEMLPNGGYMTVGVAQYLIALERYMDALEARLAAAEVLAETADVVLNGQMSTRALDDARDALKSYRQEAK